MTSLAPAACAIAVAGLLLAEVRGSQAGRWLCKPVASAAFVATAWLVGAAASPYGRLVLVGQVLGMLGDVLLVPRREATFLAGLVTFLAGHVAYAVAFAGGHGSAPVLPCVLATAALVPAAWRLHRWLLPHVPAPMAWPVRAYLVVICAMVVAATLAPAAAQPLAAIGALAFFASDICVARDKFVTGGPANALVGLPLYYGAQLLIAFSAAQA